MYISADTYTDYGLNTIYRTNHYSSEDQPVEKIVFYTICGMMSSVVLPAAILLTRSHFPIRDQPWRTVLWVAAGYCGEIVGKLNSLSNKSKANLLISLQGLTFSIVSLGVTSLFNRIQRSSQPPVSINLQHVSMVGSKSYEHLKAKVSLSVKCMLFTMMGYFNSL